MFLDIVRKDVQLQRVASTGNGEYSGPCPVCGGNDRFRVWPNEGDKGRFWCRQCDIKGDSIDYLRVVKGLSFQDACLELDVKPQKHRIPKMPVVSDWRSRPEPTQTVAMDYNPPIKRKTPPVQPDVEECNPVVSEKPTQQNAKCKPISRYITPDDTRLQWDCYNCEFMRDTACIGGPYPRLILALDACPTNCGKQE